MIKGSSAIAAITVILVLVSGSTLSLMSYYQLSLVELINRSAQVLGVASPGQLLILPMPLHTDTSLSDIELTTASRIVPHLWREKNSIESPDFFSRRVTHLKQSQHGFSVDCNRTRLGYRLNCFMKQPNSANFAALLETINAYTLVKPRVRNYRTNSLEFLMALDALKASQRLSPAQTMMLDKRLNKQLQSLLSLLDDRQASIWHSRTSLSAEAFLAANVLGYEGGSYRALYRRALGHFNDTVHALEASPTWPSGYNYWINNRALLAVLALNSYAHAHKPVMQRQRILALIEEIGLAMLYVTRPDLSVQGWGDEGPRIDLKDETVPVIDVIASITNNQALYEFAAAVRRKFGWDSYYRGHRWLLPWLYEADSQQLFSGLGQHLPLSKLFGRDMSNHTIMRSGWQLQDTFVSYRAGHIFSHHQHYDAGHFTLFKGAPLMVDAAQYNGSVITPRRLHHDIRTLSKNSLLIQQQDEVISRDSEAQHVITGGQRVVMPKANKLSDFAQWQQSLNESGAIRGAELINYRHAPRRFSAISSDLTHAYNSTRYVTRGATAKVKQVIRHLAYLYQHDIVFSYDRIISTDESFKTKWLGHTVNRPIVDSVDVLRGQVSDGILLTSANRLNVENGVGRLTMSILAPATSKTMLIGGAKFQHYVENDADDRQLDGQFYNKGFTAQPWHDQGRWRIEISPVSQSVQTRYVVAMQAGLAGDVEPLDIMPVDSGDNGIAQLGKLLVLWPNSNDSWQLVAQHNSDNIIVFLDKAQTLSLKIEEEQASELIEGKIGFNLIEHGVSAGHQLTLDVIGAAGY